MLKFIIFYVFFICTVDRGNFGHFLRLILIYSNMLGEILLILSNNITHHIATKRCERKCITFHGSQVIKKNELPKVTPYVGVDYQGHRNLRAGRSGVRVPTGASRLSMQKAESLHIQHNVQQKAKRIRSVSTDINIS